MTEHLPGARLLGDFQPGNASIGGADPHLPPFGIDCNGTDSLGSKAEILAEAALAEGHDVKKTEVAGLHRENIRRQIVQGGALVYDFPSLRETAAWSLERFGLLYGEHKRLANPHTYHVGVTRELFDLRRRLIEARSS